MNTIQQTTSYILVTAVMLTLGLVTAVAPAHALSCINPVEMVDRYVSEAEYSIALIRAGEVETTGSEHDQVVTVLETYKGTVGEEVKFTYDDTWQYLCAGGPAEVGKEVVYVTNEGRVVQSVTSNTELYSALMTALENVPEVATPEPVIEAKRSLMERVIALLQELLSLLGVSPEREPEPEPEILTPTVENIVGMSVAEAEVYASTMDTPFRVVEIDGEPQPTTKDYRPGRINASVENDVVVSYTIEGESEEESGAHDEIIGMSQTEAEAYATENDVPFRIGRIDDEYFAVTMDYRPGRITAEIEDGVIVEYSVE